MITENRAIRLFLVSLLILTIAGSASAYVDPGTGSMFFQALIAGVIGSLVTIASFWTRIKLFFAKLFGRKPLPTKSPDA
jgi:hypothetical protein